MGKSRQAEHQALIEWLLIQVEEHAVDAVLIAGDIFDTGSPPSYARELYSHLVVKLHSSGVSLLLLGGNHDSVATLGESRSMLAVLSTTVVAAVSAPADHLVVLPTRGGNGEAGCIVCAVPFIRPRDVLQSQAGQSAEDKQQSMQAAIQAYYQGVYAAGQARQAELQRALGRFIPLIATGHLTTVGASSNESVREIYVGSLDAFPTAAFPPVDYIALGHIHKPQKLSETVRYSGSPIPLSFSERHDPKFVLILTVEAGKLSAVETLPTPVLRELRTFSGCLDEVWELLENYQPATELAALVELNVVEPYFDPQKSQHFDLMLREFEKKDFKIIKPRLTFENRQKEASELFTVGTEIEDLTPQDVFERRLESETLDDDTRALLLEAFTELLEEVQQTH